MHQKIKPIALPVVIMILLYFAFTWRFFAGDATLNIFPDNEWFLGPIFSYASAAIRNNDWPLRMSSVLGGIPLFNSPQVSTLYPFYLLFLDIFGSPLKSISALHWITLFHLGILQINFYVLLRTLNISSAAAITALIFIVFNLTTLEILKWTNLIASYSWLPLYLAGLIRSLDAPWKPSGMLLLIGGFSMMSYAMVGQPLVLAGFMTVILLTGRIVSCGGFLAFKATGGASCFASAITIALLVSSLAIFPVISDLSGMIRWIGSASVLGNAKIPFEHFLTDQLALREFPSFIFPGGQRHAIAHPYVGLLPILFALVAVRSGLRHWAIFPFCFIAFYSALSAFGDNLGLAYVNYQIPIVNKIREPSYFLLPFNLALGVLAAFGMQSLLERAKVIREKGPTVQISKYVIIGAVTLLIVGLIYYYKLQSPTLAVATSVGAFFVAIFLVPISLQRYAVTSVGMLYLFSLAIQLLTVTWRPPSVTNSDYLRLNLVRLETAISKIVEMDPDRQFRVIFGGDINRQIAAMLASYQGVRTLNSYINPLPVSQFHDMYHHGPRKDSYSRGLGAKFLLCGACTDTESHGYRLAATVAEYSIYVADDALPYFYATSNLVGTASSLQEYIELLTANEIATFPLILDSRNPSVFSRHQDNANCIVHKEEHSLNKLVFVSHCKKPAYFVLNEFFSASWHVATNGIAARPERVNGNQIGVRVQAGSSVIQFTYKPWAVTISTYSVAFGIICLMILILRVHPFSNKIQRLRCKKVETNIWGNTE